MKAPEVAIALILALILFGAYNLAAGACAGWLIGSAVCRWRRWRAMQNDPWLKHCGR